jgi:hypothetical protein
LAVVASILWMTVFIGVWPAFAGVFQQRIEPASATSHVHPVFGKTA